MKIVRRCLSAVLCLCLTGGILSAFAETEPNNTPETATLLQVNGSNSGALSISTDVQDWWKLTIPSDGKLVIATMNTGTTTSPFEIDNYIYDQNKTTQLAGYLHGGSHPEDTSLVVNLLAGTYYVKSSCWSGAGTYTITAAFIPTQHANDAEFNDSAGVANAMAVNTSSTGHLGFYGNGYTDRDDWRMVVIPADGKLVIATYSDATLEVDNSIYDQNKTSALAGYKYGGAHREDTSEVINLVAGTYYMRSYAYAGYGSYTVKNIFTPAPRANDAEPNDSAGAASVFPLTSAATGHLGYIRAGYNDAADWRSVTTTTDGKLVVATLSDPTLEIDNAIYDQDRKTVLASYKTGGAHVDDTSEVLNLGSGTYYVRTLRYAGFGTYSITNGFQPAPLANDAEPNGTAAGAKALVLNTRGTGHLGYYQSGLTDDNDYFTIAVASAVDTLFVRTDASPTLEIDMHLTNAAGGVVGGGTVSGIVELATAPKIPAGTYYLQVKRWSGYGSYYVIASTTRPAGQTVGVEAPAPAVPADYALSQNFPNPFNPTTTIRYAVAAPGMVRLAVYDMLGREVAVLVNEVKQAGAHGVDWNAAGMPSGVYVYRLQAGKFSDVKRLVLQK